MDLKVCIPHIALPAVLVFVILLGCSVDAYMGPSCKRCMHTGDWASCTACYTSKSGIVPFYGMSKRSGGEEEESFLSDGDYPLENDDIPLQEVRKRGSSLAAYCCMRFGDSHCCTHTRITPYYGKRSGGYDVMSGEGCDLCQYEDTFDFSYCLRCLKKRK